MSEPFNCPLRRTVRSNLSIGRAAPARAEIHDDPIPAFDHGWHKVANDIDHTFDVYIDHSRKLRRLNFPQWGVLIDDRRIVQQKVGSTAGLQNNLCPRAHLIIRSHVHDGEVIRFLKFSL